MGLSMNILNFATHYIIMTSSDLLSIVYSTWENTIGDRPLRRVVVGERVNKISSLLSKTHHTNKYGYDSNQK